MLANRFMTSGIVSFSVPYNKATSALLALARFRTDLFSFAARFAAAYFSRYLTGGAKKSEGNL
jgi:hypothetical protein